MTKEKIMMNTRASLYKGGSIRRTLLTYTHLHEAPSEEYRQSDLLLTIESCICENPTHANPQNTHTCT